MRGIAAWAVLTYHMVQDSLPAFVPRAYLAVDFFFALSGFVVSAAYTRRLQSPGNVSRYYLTRLIRLYPLIVLGAVLGAAGQLHVYTPLVLVMVLITGALLVPTPLAPASEGRVAFAANPPSWSLFFEVLVNLAFGPVSRVLSVPALAGILAVSGAALTMSSFAAGTTGGGVYWPTLWVGLPHVFFSFPLGVLLHRLWAAERLPRVRAPLALLLIALVTVFSVPRLNGAPDILIDLFAIGFVFPVLVIAGLKPGTNPLAVFLGELSYPAYILQAPFAQHVRDIPRHLHVTSPYLSLLLLLGLQVPYFGFAYVAYRYFDQPVRAWLNRRLGAGVQTPAATVP